MLRLKNKGAILLALATSVLAAGCGAQPKETVMNEGVETRIISTAQGDVEVPSNPQRVIVTYCVGDALALGVKPVAIYDVEGTAYEKEVEGVPVWEKFEAEQLLSYEPDLLIVANQEQYDIASKIAPTILLPFTEQTMEERVRFMGDVLNKQEEAEGVLKAFYEKLDAAKSTLGEKSILDKTFSIVEGDDNGGVWIYGDKWGRGGDLIYSHLGFRAPEIVEKEIIAGEQYRDVSMEVIGEYIGDYIIIDRGLEGLEGNTIWESLPAVKEGHIIPIDFTLFYDIDIYSSSVQLDYLMDALLKIQE